MNLFFRLLILLLFPSLASAIQISALYSASCKREIGVILQVKPNHVKILNLAGKVKEVPRFGVIYWTNYPIDRLPIVRRTEISKAQSYKIKTRVGNKIRHLVSGWPIGYTQDKVSFLTLKGTEVSIDRRSIWDIDYTQMANPNFKVKAFKEPIKFEHPYIFRNCSNTKYPAGSNGRAKTVYPQEILSNEITIKRELDLLESSYNYVKRYIKEKRFYPVPEVYKNKTSLGLWLSAGSRYGASQKRSNNLSPLLINEYSSDVFNYQSIIKTGNGPMSYSVHEEVQSHLQYGFKASYFHMDAMVDPNLILVGQNYKWFKEDFDREGDDKLNDQVMIELGFDFGHWDFGFIMNHVVNLGTYFNDDVFSKSINMSGFAINYQNHLFALEFRAENGSLSETTNFSGASGEVKLDHIRVNFKSDFWDKFQLQYSLIMRDYTYNSNFAYKSTSLTNAAYLYYTHSVKYKFAAFLSIENHENSYGATSTSQSDNQTYFKLGAFASLSF